MEAGKKERSRAGAGQGKGRDEGDTGSEGVGQTRGQVGTGQ